MISSDFKSIIIALLKAIGASFLWGLLFAVPLFLEDFYSLDIVLGRFFFYGVTSMGLLSYYLIFHKDRRFLKYFKEAALCAVIMNLVHFTGMTLGIRFASAPLITIIMGTSPIAITVVTCFIKKEMSPLKILMWPCLFILVGIILMNVEVMAFNLDNISISDYLLGLFFGMIALGTWVWYLIYNSEFLKKNQDIDANQWTVLIGVQTLWLTLTAIGARYYLLGPEHFERFHWSYDSGQLFLASTCILGVFCSWVAFALWNSASARIPASLGGQLSILESIFGLGLVYFIQSQLPTWLEVTGIFLILIGVSGGLYLYTKEPTPIEENAENLVDVS